MIRRFDLRSPLHFRRASKSSGAKGAVTPPNMVVSPAVLFLNAHVQSDLVIHPYPYNVQFARTHLHCVANAHQRHHKRTLRPRWAFTTQFAQYSNFSARTIHTHPYIFLEKFTTPRFSYTCWL
jgi:hypothetical protein